MNRSTFGRKNVVLSTLVVAVVGSVMLYRATLYSRRSVGGDYYLNLDGESWNFAVVSKRYPDPNSSPLGGLVELIGRTNSIVGCFVSRYYRNGTDGWYTLDTVSGRVLGPLSYEEFQGLTGLSSNLCVTPSRYIGVPERIKSDFQRSVTGGP